MTISQSVRHDPQSSGFFYEWTDKPSVRSAAKELAATAGAAVKKAYPVVMVTVVDAEDGTIEVVKE